MIETSSAPRVKKALLDLIRANAAFVGPEILVSYAHPGSLDQRVLVYFDRVHQREHAAAMGRRRREEDLTIDLIVDVFESGDEAQETEERCWALVAALEEILRAHPEVPTGAEPSGTIVGWAEIADVDVTPYIQKGQRYVEAICKLHVKNRK